MVLLVANGFHGLRNPILQETSRGPGARAQISAYEPVNQF